MDIFDAFREAANPEKAAQMSSYMRDQFPFLGIQAPERKKLGRDILKALNKAAADWDFIFMCWEKPEREFQYLAIDYLDRIKSTLTPDDIPNIRGLIIHKSWWDTVDGLDILAGNITQRYPEVEKVMLEWSVDKNFWLRRAAIDHQLTRKDKTNTALLARIIENNLGSTEFFINKAIGWSLRDYSKVHPEWVREFIEKHRHELAPLSIREASKYITKR